MIRRAVTFVLLATLKALSHLFFRFDWKFVGDVPEDPWDHLRVVAILNHTSLFEPIFAAIPPFRFFWNLSRHGIVPVARKTLKRPLAGSFFRFVAPHVISLTRKRDETWQELLAKVDDPQSLLIILPEGRMKRRDGLDAHGRPLTVRGGIADVLGTVDEGRLLLAYSGGLHHIQAPGDRFPRLFRTARMNLEVLDAPAYREALMKRAGGDPDTFTRLVIEDLTRRRDLHCPPETRSG